MAAVKLRFFWLSSFICLMISSLFAQTRQAIAEHDTVKARRYFERGMELRRESKDDSVVYYLNEASSLFQKSSAWLDYAKCLWNLGEYFLQQEKNNESIVYVDQALAVVQMRLPGNHHLLGNLYVLRGGNLIPLGKYDSAEVFLLRGLEEFQYSGDIQSVDIAYCHYRLGWLYMLKSEFAKALSHSQRCLEIQEILKSDDLMESHNLIGAIFFHKADYFQAKEHWETGLALSYADTSRGILDKNLSLLSNLGALYYEQGNYQRAYEMYSKSLEWQASMFEELTRFDAVSFFNIAEVFEKQGQYKDSEVYFRKSLDVYKKQKAYDHPNIVEIYDRLGSLYFIQDKLTEALNFYQKALQLNKSISHNSTLSASLFLQLGRAHLANGQLDSSAFYFQESFDLNATIHHELHPKMADNHLQFAILRRAQSDWDLTFESCDKALYSVTHGSKNLDQLDLSDIRLISKGIEVLSTYANYLEDAFLDHYLTSEGLAKAMMYIDIAIELIQKNRLTAFDQKAQRDYSRQYLPVYHQGMNLALRLHQETKDEKYLAKAFELMSAGKAFELHRSEQGRQEPISYALPDSIRAYERALKVDISFYQEAILNHQGNSAGFDTALVKGYDDQLFNLKQDFEQLQLRLNQDFPKYFRLKYSNQTIDLSELQRRLQADELLIEYLWNEEEITLMVVSKHEIDFTKVAIDNQFMSHLERLDTVFQKPDIEVPMPDFSSSAQLVYEQILAPALEFSRSDIRKLLIIPDGPLTNLNFDLLLNSEPDDESDWKDLPYLIRDYAIATGYSASLFFEQTAQPKHKTSGLLAFSFGEEDENITGDHMTMDLVRSTDLSRLPGSAREIKTIAEMVDGDYYYGRQASEQIFKKVAENYQVLHLAVHGTVNEEHPDYSKLHFYARDTVEDGHLHVYELYNMELNADLAVLSACNTGSGKYQTGEGIMSLGHAFSYAGVNSLLLTRWDLSDEAAPEIMRAFYNALKKGKSKSEALRLAKLEYLERASLFHTNPFYWGSFFVLGDDSPVEFESPNRMFYSRILWSTFLLMLLFYLRNRFRS